MVEPLCPIDVLGLPEWITNIPLSEWPQQSHTELMPAMVHDPEWHAFRAATGPFVGHIMGIHFPECREYQRMLSCIMPGKDIEPHTDQQDPKWIIRIHVPLTTNPKAIFFSEDKPYHMEVGMAYKVNTKLKHAISNDGETPRIHLMWDVLNG